MNMEFSRGQAPEVGQDEKPSSIERAFAADIFEQELRSRQEQAWFDLGSDNWNNQNFVDVYYEHSAGLTAEYLENAGVTQDQPEYEEFYNIARKYSWDQMSDEEWQFGYPDEEHPENLPVSGHRALQREHRAMFGYGVSRDGEERIPYRGGSSTAPDNSEPTPNTPSAPDDPESTPDDDHNTERSLDDLETQIRIAENDVNEALAGRMKVGYFRRKKKTELQADLSQKRRLLNELRAERNDRFVEQLRSENISDEQIVETLANQTNAGIARQGEDQHEAMIGNKWYQRQWNKLSERYANAERSTKIATVVIASLALVPVAAAAGTATVAGAGALAGIRVLRTYHLKKSQLYETSNNPEPIEYMVGDEYKSVDEVLAEANAYPDTIIDERIEKADDINKKAFYGSMGAAALVGVGVVVEHWDTVKEVGSHVGNYAGRVWDYFNGDDTKAIQVPTEPVNPGPGTGPEVNPPRPPVPEIPKAPSFDVAQFADASTIDMTEGWYSTFNQLGVTDPGEQYALLHNQSLMNQLKDMGLAYQDNRPEVGGWGMNMTPDGKLPPEALKTIRDMAYQNHYTLAR